MIPGKALTLAAIGADEATWGEMEARWEELRKARGNPRFVHMTDLMALPRRASTKDGPRMIGAISLDGLINTLLFV